MLELPLQEDFQRKRKFQEREKMKRKIALKNAYIKSLIAINGNGEVIRFENAKAAKRFFHLHEETDVISLVENGGVFGGFYFDYELE